MFNRSAKSPAPNTVFLLGHIYIYIIQYDRTTPFIIFGRSMELGNSAWMILEGLSDWGFGHGGTTKARWMVTKSMEQRASING